MSGKTVYPQTKTLSVDVLSVKGAFFKGCYLSDGIVRPALKAVPVTADCPSGVTFATYAEKPQKMLLTADDGLYYSKNGRTFIKSEAEFAASEPFIFDKQDGTDEAYLAGDDTLMVIKPYTNLVLSFDCGIFGGVIKNGRLFALDKEDGYKIRWSGAGGGTDWTEGINGSGWVRVYPERGVILNLVSFKQKLMAVCEYGLAYLSAFGAPENYKLGYMDGVTGRIYKNTAAAAGGKLVFYSENGFYAYNGIKAEKLDFSLTEGMIPRCVLSVGDRYIVSGYNGDTGAGALFVFDMQKGAGYALDCDASAMCFYGKPYCFGQGGAYVLEQGGEVDFTSGATDFGSPKRKVLKSIHIGSPSAVDVTVTSGGKTRILRGVKGYCRPNLSGTQFKITIRGEGKICGVKAYAEVADGV